MKSGGGGAGGAKRGGGEKGGMVLVVGVNGEPDRFLRPLHVSPIVIYVKRNKENAMR